MRTDAIGQRERGTISQTPSSLQSQLIDNWSDDDANCIIVTIAHKCSPADCSWTSFLRKKGWYLRLNFFQKLSAKSGGHMIWSRASGAEALASFQTRQRCLALENFFSREIIFWDVFYYFAHIVHSFLNLVLWVVFQERGKLGTEFGYRTRYNCWKWWLSLFITMQIYGLF